MPIDIRYVLVAFVSMAKWGERGGGRRGEREKEPFWIEQFLKPEDTSAYVYFCYLLFQIYVVDSLDRERIGKAKEEFQVIYSK